jgi:hypothetical protein
MYFRSMTELFVPILRLFVLFSTFLFFCGRLGTNSASLPNKLVLPDSLSLEQAIVSISKDPVLNSDFSALVPFLSALTHTTDSIESQAGVNDNPEVIAKAIIDVTFNSWKITFDPCDTVPQTMLPQLVYKSHRGACLGTSLIILMLADKMHCPVFGVLLPGHFFCRFDDGTSTFNIEPNRSGFCHPDSYYRSRYDMANRPWYNLRSLTKKETIGVLCYNVGAVCLNRRHSDRAIAYFAEAARRLQWFPEAQGNLALAYAQAGYVDSSMALFDRLFSAHPGMPGLAANFGAIAMSKRQYQKAVEVFKKGLLYFPEDSSLLSGFAQANKRLGGS